MSKYTKGKWMTNKISDCLFHICSLEGGHICRMEAGSYDEKDKNKANAQLISAAPELLEACKEIQHLNPHKTHKIFIRLKQAIAKAEGLKEKQ